VRRLWNRGSRGEWSERFPNKVAERVRWAQQLIDDGKRTGEVDQSRLREALGVLQAAKHLLDAQERGAAWAGEPKRLDAVFELEVRLYEGEDIRDGYTAGTLVRQEMDAKVLALREIINDIMASHPLDKES
jgi:hypothetical protein